MCIENRTPVTCLATIAYVYVQMCSTCYTIFSACGKFGPVSDFTVTCSSSSQPFLCTLVAWNTLQIFIICHHICLLSYLISDWREVILYRHLICSVPWHKNCWVIVLCWLNPKHANSQAVITKYHGQILCLLALYKQLLHRFYYLLSLCYNQTQCLEQQLIIALVS